MQSLREALINRPKNTSAALPEIAIKDFLNANYGLKEGKYELVKIHDKYYVNTQESIKLEESTLDSLTGRLFKFGKVYAFSVISCPNIETLEGAPDVVIDEYVISDCMSLQSLEGSPLVKGLNISIINCPKITSLKGLPKHFSGTISLHGIYIKNLIGCPPAFTRVRISNCPELLSLKGCPNTNQLNIEFCAKLKSLEGSPKWLDNMDIAYCKNLKTLKGGPEIVHFTFNCQETGIKNFVGAPTSADKYIFIDNPNLKSDEGKENLSWFSMFRQDDVFVGSNR